MASLKIVLRKKQNPDGTYPLAIRITKDRKSSYVYLGHSVREKDWDSATQHVRKSHPNATRLNNLLLKKRSEANDKLLELEAQQNDTSSRVIRSSVKSAREGTFFAQAALYLENLRTAGKYNIVVADQPRVNRFKEFLQSADVPFKEITVTLLNRYRAYLKGTRNISERTIVNHLLLIRTIYNQAIKAGVADPKHYPFGRDKIVIKFPDSLKLGLSAEEVKMLEGIDLADQPKLNLARHIWLFSFYFAGVRISDVLRMKWEDFQDSRLHYKMGKNNKVDSLKIPEKVAAILQQYSKDKKHRAFVFPGLEGVKNMSDSYEVQQKIALVVKLINKSLRGVAKMAEINKPLTTHIARHTFGNLAGEAIPIQMLQKLYRHTSITTTIGYQSSFIHKDADAALDAVIGF